MCIRDRLNTILIYNDVFLTSVRFLELSSWPSSAMLILWYFILIVYHYSIKLCIHCSRFFWYESADFSFLESGTFSRRNVHYLATERDTYLLLELLPSEGNCVKNLVV